MRLEGAMAVAVAGPPAARPLSSFSGTRVHAIAAIGNPGRFFTGLQVRGIDVIAHPFPDHHVFSAADLAFNDGLPVLMTEKDAIKCVGFAGANVWCVPVSAEVPTEFIEELLARLRVRNNPGAPSNKR
jgi:tetraacyldisaccharide 4'-kinase